jgi:hypothetical protein
MTRRRAAALLSAPFGVLALLAPLALAGPADAASHVHRDAEADVTLVVEEGAPTPTVPDNRSADVVRIKTTYAAGVVTLAATTRAPFPTTGQTDLLWEVKTGTRRYQVAFSAAGTETGLSMTRGYDDVDCVGLTTRTRRSTRLISVPAACLDDPRSVRTGLSTYVRNSRGPGAFLDDAQRDGSAPLRTVLGPKVTAD